jgi:hypothetical protein
MSVDMDRVEALEEAIRAINGRLEALEAGGGRRPRGPVEDELCKRVLEVMRGAPSVRLNASAIAETLDDENVNTEKVYTRLLTLSRHGKIIRHQKSGKQASFQIGPKEVEG